MAAPVLSDLINNAPADTATQLTFAEWFSNVIRYAESVDNFTIATDARSGLFFSSDSEKAKKFKYICLAELKTLQTYPNT